MAFPRYLAAFPSLLLALAALLPSPARALPAAEYRELLAKYRPQVITCQQDMNQAQMAQPGMALEIRGQVTGVMQNGGVALVQVRLRDEQSFLFSCTKSLPEVQLGSLLRALVLPDPEHPTSYSLVAAAWESVLAPTDPKPAPAPAPAGPVAATSTAAPARPPSFPSRGSPDAGYERNLLLAYQRAVRYFNHRLSERESVRIASHIISNSRAWGVDARLVMAVVAVESGFKPYATSPKGAMGLGQLMPATARGLGVTNAYDPEQNLAGAIRLISGHLERTGDVALALACYNAGSGAVRRYGGVPPYRETINYIRKVTDLYFRLAPEMRPG